MPVRSIEQRHNRPVTGRYAAFLERQCQRYILMDGKCREQIERLEDEPNVLTAKDRSGFFSSAGGFSLAAINARRNLHPQERAPAGCT